jgi:hypothetical protein
VHEHDAFPMLLQEQEGESPWPWIVWRTGRQGLSSQRAFPRSRWTNAKILQVLPVDCAVSVTVQMIRATGKCSNSALGHS